MTSKQILKIEIQKLNKDDILEKIKKYIVESHDFVHVVSLNPENMVVAYTNELFRKVITEAQIKIIDGIGVVVAGQILHDVIYERVTGVGLMEELLSMASQRSLRVMLIGAKSNLALKLADCYNRKFPTAKFYGVQGIQNIISPTHEEEEKIFSIVSAFKPQLVFAAFGSPFQELWLWKNREKFRGMICMGVGGGFDYLSQNVPRAPHFIRKAGLEWLFRLGVQPCRIKRQIRLFYFMWLVLLQKLRS